jgi:hypothetical protein
MGYFRFFYVEFKSFEIHSKIGLGGVRLAEELSERWSWEG